jgi:hypothetical protein
MLLERMIPISTDGIGYGPLGRLAYEHGGMGLISLSEFKDLVSRARNSTSSFTEMVIAPLEQLLQEAIERGDEKTYLDFRRLGLLADHFIGVEDILQSLCERFPEEIPFIETQWAHEDHDRYSANISGGASFITPEGIESITTRSFLSAKRAEYLASKDPAPAYR